MPDRTITDRGTAFTPKDFEMYCKSKNVKNILNAVSTPRANGHAQHTNRIILSMLLTSNDIDSIRLIQWSINIMVNSTSKRSPFQLLYGYEPQDILKIAITNIIQNHDQQLLTDAELDQRSPSCCQETLRCQTCEANYLDPWRPCVGRE